MIYSRFKKKKTGTISLWLGGISQSEIEYLERNKVEWEVLFSSTSFDWIVKIG